MVRQTMFLLSEAITDRVSRISEPLASEVYDDVWRSRWRQLAADVGDISTMVQAGLMLMEFEAHA